MTDEIFEVNEQNELVTDYHRYLVDSGIYEKFAQSNITIRITDSLPVMRKQSGEQWNHFIEKMEKEARKRRQSVNVQLAQVIFWTNEIKVYTGFLEKGLPDFDKMVTMEYLKELHEKLEIWERKSKPTANEISREPGHQPFTWTGSPGQLDALYEGLKDKKYIDPGTSNEAFRSLFTGEKVMNRVTWTKKALKSKAIAKSAVISMFNILAEKGMIPKTETTNKAKLFRKLQGCFCDQAGNPLKFEHKHRDYSKDYADDLRQIIASL